MTMTSSTPASTVVTPRAADTVATLVPSPPRTKASGDGVPATSNGAPRVGADVDARPVDLLEVEKMLGERPSVSLDGAVEVVLGERVGRVLHRVGRDDMGIVAVGVGRGEITFEGDRDGEVVEPVPGRISMDADDSDGSLAVTVRAKLDHRRVISSCVARCLAGLCEAIHRDVDDCIECAMDLRVAVRREGRRHVGQQFGARPARDEDAVPEARIAPRMRRSAGRAQPRRLPDRRVASAAPRPSAA